MDEENSNFNQNVDEIVPQSTREEIIRPIKERPKYEQSKEAMLNKKAQEKNKYLKRKKRKAQAKASKKKNRKKRK